MPKIKSTNQQVVQKKKSTKRKQETTSQPTNTNHNGPKDPQPTPIGAALRTLGTGVGSYFGAPALGNMAGGFVSRLLGQGDYEVKTNTLLAPGSSQLNSAAVVMGPDGRRGVRIQEREFIGIVYGSTTFSNVSYPINPANYSTFPWLSTLAANFDEWRPNGIAFSFKSTSAAFNGTNQALGVVIGATDYDPTDLSYSSRLEMESAAYSVSNKASEDWVHLIECDPEERGRAVMKTSTGVIPPGASVMDYVLGNFQVATDGQSSSNMVLGELWVSYDITFYKKQLYGGQIGNSIGLIMAACPTSSLGTVSLTAPLGTYTNVQYAGNIPMRWLTDQTFSLPTVQNGYYRVMYRENSSTTMTPPVGVYYPVDIAGCTNLVVPTYTPPNNVNEIWYNIPDTNCAGVANSVTSYSGQIVVQVTGPNPIFKIQVGGTSGGTISGAFLVLEQVAPPAAVTPYFTK